MPLRTLRRRWLTRPLFGWAQRALPGMSETEREALEAGDVWWDRDLFSGNPDWRRLADTPAPTLTEEERAFLDGPVRELCALLDEWEINWDRADLPPEVWDFLKAKGFFAMIIPKEHGGLAFSAYANSEVVRTIASRSLVGAVTVMVPNSLGPGELLMQFGTEAQQDYWLPRLADGREVPAFALTSPEAGSDAASMVDSGVVCKGTYEGEEVLGIRLNWHKRYITLSPVATVLGLAFKLHDPDRLLGGEEALGITVGLIPTHLPGVETGRRHLPSFQMFQNGPTWGRDVFIPFDNVIGGRDQVGQGWKMLMSALAAGRGISLPSLSASAVALSARTTGAYARVREQFGIPVGKFEGIQERLGRMAANAYAVDAARRLTCAGLAQGHQPSVISAIMKAHATYRMREAVDDAMDVHAGKAVIDGPLNYVSGMYRAVPVGITVEGANILTRSMIIFGQGAIRCHPWVLQEMLALEQEDRDAALAAFDESFWGHVGHALRTFGRAWARAWTGGRSAPAPPRSPLKAHYRQLGRYAAAFALLSDVALVVYGGALKRREMLSGRLGDVLSELYFLSAVLKRWEDEGRHAEDRPLVDFAMARGLARIERALDAVLGNLANRPLAWLLRPLILPLGLRQRGPSDALTRRCAELVLAPSPTRDRLTDGLFLERGPGAANGVADLETAFDLVHRTEPLRRRMADTGTTDRRQAREQGVLSDDELALLEQADAAVARVIAVDDFAAEDLKRQNFATAGDTHPAQGGNDGDS